MKNVFKSLVRATCLFLLLTTTILLNGCQTNNIDTQTNEIITTTSTVESTDLENIINSLENTHNLLSISILQGDNLIIEKYYHQVDENYINNVYSVTKSIVSLLIGIAIDEGYIESVNQPISDFIDIDGLELTDVHRSLRIEDLLKMSSGLVWEPGEAEYQLLRSTTEPLKLMLERPIDFTPGTTFRYTNTNAHLLSLVISNATGMSTKEYANKTLFQPLGIENYDWYSEASGNTYGSADLFLTCQDMTKIGKMVRDKGLYDDQRIVSESWIKHSTSAKIEKGGHPNSYGYFWWVNESDDLPYYAAIGYGGQYIYIFESLDLVITSSFTGSVYPAQAEEQSMKITDVIINKIIPYFNEQAME